MLEVRLLGPFEVSRDGQVVALPGQRLAALVSVLALAANRPVPTGVLAERLWGEKLPQRTKQTLHTYVARLRQHLGDDAIETLSAGYALRVEPERVDALRLVSVVRDAERAEDPERKRQLLRSAAELWRDTPFAGSVSEWLAAGEAARLTELHLSAIEQRIDLDLGDGRYDGLPAELQELTSQHRLRESLWSRRIAALRLTGRTAEALECYEEIRTTIADELGVDPAPALQQEFARVLAAESSGPLVVTSDSGTPTGPPRQLPPDLRHFTGRRNEQRLLDSILHGAAPELPIVITITGPGGAGKTSLAVHWAHRVRDRFPGGQLFVNLRGFAADEPVAPGAALLAFLRALGVPPGQVPSEAGERAALFRTLTADRQLLLLIDNARNSEQVRDLIPASGSLVVVTSRNQLRSLGAHAGAERVVLEPLSPEDAVQLLATSVGADRVAAEPVAVAELAGLCAGLPLALAVAAESARRTEDRPFAELVSALRDEKRTLDVFADPDDQQADLRRVLSWSYQLLEPETARVFRLLGLHPATPINGRLAAALADLAPQVLEGHLDRLVAANLASRSRSGHYHLHDLLRVYAAELTSQLDDAPVRRAAIGRALEWYLHTVQNAAIAMDGSITRGSLADSPHQPLGFADAGTAMQWLGSEHTAFEPWIRTAVDHGYDDHAWRIAWRLRGFLDAGYYVEEARKTARLGVSAAERLGEPRARYLAWNTLGSAEYRADQPEAAQDCAQRAIEIARSCGDVAAEVMFRTNLAVGQWSAGDLEGALAEMTRVAVVADRYTEPSDEPLPLRRDLIQHALGGLNILLGNLETARPQVEAAVRLSRASGSWYSEALALTNLAEWYERKGDDGTADFYACESLDRLQGFHTPTATFGPLAVRARLAARANDPERARTLAHQALALLPENDRRTTDLRDLLTSLDLRVPPPPSPPVGR